MSELSINVPAVHLGEGDTVKDGLASLVRTGEESDVNEVFSWKGEHVGSWVEGVLVAESERPTHPDHRHECYGDEWFFIARSPTQNEKDLGMTVRMLMRMCTTGLVLTDEHAAKVLAMLKRVGVEGSPLREGDSAAALAASAGRGEGK